MVNKILVVEDQKKYQEVLKNYLRDYELYIADSCEDAERILNLHQDIKLAIVNMNLEEREAGYPNDQQGLDVLEFIQNQYPHLPRIVLTGEVQNLNGPLSLYAPLGVNDVFYKALIYDRRLLLSIVNRYISTDANNKLGTSAAASSQNVIINVSGDVTGNITVGDGNQAKSVLETVEKKKVEAAEEVASERTEYDTTSKVAKKPETEKQDRILEAAIEKEVTVGKATQLVTAQSDGNSLHVGKYENAVFVSYAWGNESEQTVDKLEKAFADRGISMVRDKKALDYKGSIKEFEQRIGQGQCIILVISDKYLRSEHCMYELVEIAENQQFRKRVFPIVLADAHIYKAVDRLIYIEHWDNEIEQLNAAIKKVKVIANMKGIAKDLDKYTRIRANIDQLTDLLSDMNALTPDIHAASGFSTVITSVELELASTTKHRSSQVSG